MMWKNVIKKLRRLFFPGKLLPIYSESVLICSGLFPICSDMDQKNEYSNMHSNGAPVRGAAFFYLFSDSGGGTWKTTDCSALE